MSAGLSRVVLKVPGHALEVGSAGCGRGHRRRVLGCGGRGSWERPGKSRGSSGGVAGPGGDVAWLGRGGRGAALRPGWKRRALGSPWPLRFQSERRPPRGPGPPGPCGLRHCGCRCCCSVGSAPRCLRQVGATQKAPPPHSPGFGGCRIRAWVPPGAYTRRRVGVFGGSRSAG